MKDRNSLTKSLHTVSVVTRVALHLQSTDSGLGDVGAVRAALALLGMRADWPQSDEVFAACVAKVKGAAK